MPRYYANAGLVLESGSLVESGVLFITNKVTDGSTCKGKIVSVGEEIEGDLLDRDGLPLFCVLADGSLAVVSIETRESSVEKLAHNMNLRSSEYIKSDKLFIEASYMAAINDEGAAAKIEEWKSMVQKIKADHPKFVPTVFFGIVRS